MLAQETQDVFLEWLSWEFQAINNNFCRWALLTIYKDSSVMAYIIQPLLYLTFTAPELKKAISTTAMDREIEDLPLIFPQEAVLNKVNTML